MLKKLGFQESRGHAAKKRCVREVWRHSARLKATENNREIDVCPRQLTLREIVSKNEAPLRNKIKNVCLSKVPGLRHQKHVASAKFSAAARVSNRWTQVVKSMVSFHDYFNEKNVTKNAAPL